MDSPVGPLLGLKPPGINKSFDHAFSAIPALGARTSAVLKAFDLKLYVLIGTSFRQLRPLIPAMAGIKGVLVCGRYKTRHFRLLAFINRAYSAIIFIAIRFQTTLVPAARVLPAGTSHAPGTAPA